MQLRIAYLSLGLATLLFACSGEDEQVQTPPTGSTTPVATGISYTPGPTPSPAATDWNALIQEVSEYLTENSGSADCLAELFAEWNIPSDGTPSCVAADLDGDGENEYVVRLVRQRRVGEESRRYPAWLLGKILIFDRPNGPFRPVLDLKDIGPTMWEERLSENPVIYSVVDINSDSRPEVFLTTSECGAHTCHLYLYGQTFRDGEWTSIVGVSAAGPAILVPMADDQLAIEDLDGDGIAELSVRVGLVDSAGAGPQREARRTYRWEGNQYALANLEYEGIGPRKDFANLRYFHVRDADDAFNRGDYGEAILLYDEAINRADLRDVGYFGEPAELLAYARYRIGLTYAASGDGPAALVALDAALAADPQALHSQLALRFRDAYAPTADLAAGCSGAVAFIEQSAQRFAELWNYGYANPNPGAEKRPLCPF